MDPIAHSLFGAALSRTRLAQESGQGNEAHGPVPGATLALVVGANLPDIDALLYFLGNDLSLLFRRGLSHGPLGLIVLPILFIAAWRFVARRRGMRGLAFGRLLGLVYLGTASHPALDWLNTYGVRFLAPFDWRWFYGDALFIVDPWMWLLLAAATLLGREVSVRMRRGFRVLGVLGAALMLVAFLLGLLPIGAVLIFVVAMLSLAVLSRGQMSGSRTRVATLLVVIFLLYALAMVSAARSSRAFVQTALEQEGFTVERLVVSPLPATPLQREWVALTENGYRIGHFDWLERPRVKIEEVTFPRLPDRDPAVERALSDPCIRGFVNWMRMPSVAIDRDSSPGAIDVQFFDLRYSRGPVVGFGGASSLVDESELEGGQSSD